MRQSLKPQSLHNSQVNSLNTMDAATRVLGEKLFAQVATVFPDLAPKITGMLIQLDKNYLDQLLKNRISMVEKIVEAAKLLQKQKQAPAQWQAIYRNPAV